MNFRHAYYIKLGRGGCWEADSIENGRLRFGWERQTVGDINDQRWDQIRLQLHEEHQGKPQVATNHYNRLRDVALATPEDVWITFHKASFGGHN